MTLPLPTSRQSRRAAGALILTCALVSAGVAQTSANEATAAKKPAAKATTPKPKSSSSTAKPAGATHTTSSGKHSRKKKTLSKRGQQKIDAERATAIQHALIREHYLSGEPAGAWNQASEDAMRRYQADHGWQTKEVPDSRALIKLGLGPSKDHLLNPESAMTTAPEPPSVPPSAEKPAPRDPPKPQ